MKPMDDATTLHTASVRFYPLSFGRHFSAFRHRQIPFPHSTLFPGGPHSPLPFNPTPSLPFSPSLPLSPSPSFMFSSPCFSCLPPVLLVSDFGIGEKSASEETGQSNCQGARHFQATPTERLFGRAGQVSRPRLSLLSLSSLPLSSLLSLSLFPFLIVVLALFVFDWDKGAKARPERDASARPG